MNFAKRGLPYQGRLCEVVKRVDPILNRELECTSGFILRDLYVQVVHVLLDDLFAKNLGHQVRDVVSPVDLEVRNFSVFGLLLYP